MFEIEPIDTGNQSSNSDSEPKPEVPQITLAPIVPLTDEERLMKGDGNDFESK